MEKEFQSTVAYRSKANVSFDQRTCHVVDSLREITSTEKWMKFRETDNEVSLTLIGLYNLTAIIILHMAN